MLDDRYMLNDRVAEIAGAPRSPFVSRRVDVLGILSQSYDLNLPANSSAIPGHSFCRLDHNRRDDLDRGPKAGTGCPSGNAALPAAVVTAATATLTFNLQVRLLRGSAASPRNVNHLAPPSRDWMRPFSNFGFGADGGPATTRSAVATATNTPLAIGRMPSARRRHHELRSPG